jgi:hypothetical protein
MSVAALSTSCLVSMPNAADKIIDLIIPGKNKLIYVVNIRSKYYGEYQLKESA